MLEIALFGEDYAHRQIVGALTRRVAVEVGVAVRLDWRSAVRGHARVRQELGFYLRDLTNQGGPYPDLIVVASDANCQGLQQFIREIAPWAAPAPAPLILAIPDPHIERWLLLDGAAFRSVFGRGCNAPAYKCGRDEYKNLLATAIHAAGITPALGGIEFAEDIVQAMDLERAMQTDNSLRRFVEELRRAFRQGPQ